MSKRLCSLCLTSSYKQINETLKRCYSSSAKLTNAEVRKKRNAIFDEEKQRQQSFIKRIEKISVQYVGEPEECMLKMNKNISTPYNCAMRNFDNDRKDGSYRSHLIWVYSVCKCVKRHINEFLTKRSLLAFVDGEPWDMHRPLEDNCVLKFLHVLDEDPKICNEAFWRTGSFILGHILETAFKDDIYVELCRFPAPRVEQGSFIYDADLKLPNWKPTFRELNCLSFEGANLWTQDMEFERLEVNPAVAQEMFEDNRFKSEQVPQIAERSPKNQITLYRMGNHIDIVKGPLIPSSAHIHRFNITAIHQITSAKYGRLQRIQAIALPKNIDLHWWKWDFLAKEARRPNRSNNMVSKNDAQSGTTDKCIFATD